MIQRLEFSGCINSLFGFIFSPEVLEGLISWINFTQELMYGVPRTTI